MKAFPPLDHVPLRPRAEPIDLAQITIVTREWMAANEKTVHFLTQGVIARDREIARLETELAAALSRTSRPEAA